MTTPLGGLVEQLLTVALAGGEVERELGRLLRSHPELTGAERALVSLQALGATCQLGTLRFRLQQAGLPATPEQVRRLQTGELSLPEPVWPTDPSERLAAERSLPGWLARLWVSELGADVADGLAKACNQPGPTTLRVNEAKATRDEAAQRLAKEGIATRPGRLSRLALQVNPPAPRTGGP